MGWRNVGEYGAPYYEYDYGYCYWKPPCGDSEHCNNNLSCKKKRWAKLFWRVVFTFFVLFVVIPVLLVVIPLCSEIIELF